ncbi:MAG: hypothetical protein CML17_12685, partial [Pusillimonas sp.]|nr:hypothetical protein [Pusillimonas sp.]
MCGSATPPPLCWSSKDVKNYRSHNFYLHKCSCCFAVINYDGRDIGDHEVQVDIAGQIALDQKIVADLLATDADVENVRNEANLFRQMGVTGVPTYIAN